MTNELIVIEPTTALQVLSDKTSVDKLIEEVRVNVMSLEGGKMDTITGRKQIRSNAFKATKSKAPVKKMVADLIAAQELKMAPFMEVVTALKANYNEFAAGMDKIRSDTNADVDAFEAELQRVEDEKIEAERVAVVDRDYDFARVLYNEYLSQVLLGESKIADMEKRAHEKAEDDRIAREKLIAEEAATAATLKAEQDAAAEKQRLVDEKEAAELLAENQRKAAIQAGIEAEQSTALLAQQEETQKEDRRVDYHKRMIQHIVACGFGTIGGRPQPYGLLFFELENKIVIDDSFEEFKGEALEARSNAIANLKSMQEKQHKQEQEQEKLRIKEKADAAALAETSRLAAIEQTKIDEANKIAAKKLADEQETATRKANEAHTNGIKKAIIADLMEHAGLSKEAATSAASALWYGKIRSINVTI